MGRWTKSDLNEASCISLVYLLFPFLRKQIYIVSSVIKISTPPSPSALSAGDLTYYFTEKIEAFRTEWPHLPITKLTNLYMCLYVNFPPVTKMSSVLLFGLRSHPFSWSYRPFSPASFIILSLSTWLFPQTSSIMASVLNKNKLSLVSPGTSSSFFCSLAKSFG